MIIRVDDSLVIDVRFALVDRENGYDDDIRFALRPGQALCQAGTWMAECVHEEAVREGPTHPPPVGIGTSQVSA